MHAFCNSRGGFYIEKFKTILQRQDNIESNGVKQVNNVSAVNDGHFMPGSGHAFDNKQNSRLQKQLHNKRFLKSLRIVTSVAASLLLIFITWKVYSFYKLSPQKIYDQVFVSYPKSIIKNRIIIGAGSIKESFVKKDFNEVILLKTSSTSLTNLDSLLIGISYLQTDEAAKAIKMLQPIVKAKTGMYQDAEFYLSLAYLMNSDFDPSIDLMQKIANDSSHLYHQQIQKKTVNEVKMAKWR